MKNSSNTVAALFLILMLFVAINGCKPEEETLPETKIEVGENEEAISGKIDLPPGTDPSTLALITTTGSFDINDDGAFVGVINGNAKQIITVENADGEVLLASFARDGAELSASSTAETILGMSPMTGAIKNSDLKTVLDQIKELPEYEVFEDEVKKSINNGIPPLSSESVSGKFNALYDKILLGESGGENIRVNLIPEEDFLVEPVIEYSNGALHINNDGTTTAAWGVAVFHEDENLAGSLIIEGNKIYFPSLGSIWDWVSTGEVSGTVFKESEPLEVPGLDEGKYQLRFESPTSPAILSSEIAREAALYNIALSYDAVFAAFGIDFRDEFLKEFVSGDDCFNKIAGTTTDLVLAAIAEEELTVPFFLDQFTAMFSASIDELSECDLVLDSFLGSSRPGAVTKYMNTLGNFLDIYSKLERSFVLGKLFGDMLVLSDITVCRQVLDGKIYPCFDLVKDETIEKQEIVMSEKVQLKVGTELDYPGGVMAVPEGVIVHWEVIQGDGELMSEQTYIGPEGVAEVIYTVGEETAHEIRASVQNSEGEIIDEVTYHLSNDRVSIVGKWEWVNAEYTYYYKDGTVTSEQETYAELLYLTLNEDGSYTNSDGNESSSGVYSFSNDQLTFTSNGRSLDYSVIKLEKNKMILSSSAVFTDYTLKGVLTLTR